MPFSVEDFHDLVRLLAEHPEWRAELLQLVLSDELLELPALVRQLVERVGTLADAQERTEARLTTLADAQERTEAQVKALAEAQARTEARLTTLADAQERTEARLKNVEGDVADLKGEVLESRYARRAGAYFSPLARRLRVLDPGRLADQLDDAVLAGQLTNQERTAILAADLVLTGVGRDDQAEIYLVVDVSWGIGVSDVARAAQRARLLERLGRPAMPVVAGDRIDSESEALARLHGVWWVLDGHTTAPAQS
jgi:septal ring factor EnvC (AmiA/AmiB activator)